MSLIENERTKLTATWLNNLAVASIVAGWLSPVAGMVYGLTNPPRDIVILISLSIAWLLAGLVLHLIARAHLGRLKP